MGIGISQGLLEHAGGHGRVEQTQIDQIDIDRIKPLSGLGQHLERRAKAIHRAGPVAELPGMGIRSVVACQALVVEPIGMTHGDSKLAHQPMRCPERQKITGRAGHPFVLDDLGGTGRSQTGLDLADQSARSVPASSRVELASSAWVRYPDGSRSRARQREPREFHEVPGVTVSQPTRSGVIGRREPGATDAREPRPRTRPTAPESSLRSAGGS